MKFNFESHGIGGLDVGVKTAAGNLAAGGGPGFLRKVGNANGVSRAIASRF